jgi:hypothetical protein
MLINSWWSTLEELSWHFDHLDILLSWAYSLPLNSLAWLWIQSEIEGFQVHLLVSLHLVALGDHLSCGILVTLGGCCHLDSLEQWRSCDKSWWLFLATSRWLWGVLVPSLTERQSNSSGLRVSLSYLTCGSVLAVSNMWTRFVLHLLATEPPSVGRHNGD